MTRDEINQAISAAVGWRHVMSEADYERMLKADGAVTPETPCVKLLTRRLLLHRIRHGWRRDWKERLPKQVARTYDDHFAFVRDSIGRAETSKALVEAVRLGMPKARAADIAMRFLPDML